MNEARQVPAGLPAVEGVATRRWLASWWRADRRVAPARPGQVAFRVGYDRAGRPVVVERYDEAGRLTSTFVPTWGPLEAARRWRVYHGSVRPWRRRLWHAVERYLDQRAFVRPLAVKLARSVWRPDYLLRIDRYDAEGRPTGAAVHVYFPDGVAAGVERYDADGRLVRFSAAH